MTLPHLPGYHFPDPAKTRYHKSQALVFENGGPAIHEEAPGIGGDLLVGQTAPKKAISSTAVYNRALGADAKAGETVPAWVAFGSEVLRLYGYFKEPIYSSQLENFRVRNVVVLFFLEDDTLEIVEPVQRNSGMPQGTFLRRHRAKKEDDTYVTVGDFRLGAEFPLYGRVFYLNDADAFTKDFLAKIGQGDGTAAASPVDGYTQTRDLREYAEKHRQRGEPKPDMLKFRQFLANDGNVLRFWAYWDDRDRPFGDLRKFVVNYFLADDTMEVNEVLSQNDGRDPFPSFVRRSQIPKEVLSVRENDPRFLSAKYYYRPGDLKVGGTINILNREMLLFDCDPFTRGWLKANFGYTDDELAPIVLPEEGGSRETKVELPPPSLIGSDEDSLRSCLSLHPKPAPKDEVKLITRMHDVLRFRAKMVTKDRVDAGRLFIVTFFLADDTIQIYEPPQRNSGIVAGKFLQRSKVVNPLTEDYFKASDLSVGGVITVNKRMFQLLEATEYAMSYMESDPDGFPQADLAATVAKIKSGVVATGKDPKDLFTQFSCQGRLDLAGLQQLVAFIGVGLSAHEAITVVRRYQIDAATAALSLREFRQLLV